MSWNVTLLYVSQFNVRKIVILEMRCFSNSELKQTAYVTIRDEPGTLSVSSEEGK